MMSEHLAGRSNMLVGFVTLLDIGFGGSMLLSSRVIARSQKAETSAVGRSFRIHRPIS